MNQKIRKSLIFILEMLILSVAVALLYRSYRRQRINAELIEAILNQDVSKAKIALSAGANPDLREHLAVNGMATSPVSPDLLSSQKNKSISNDPVKGSTLLMLAEQEGNTELVRLLLERGANLNAKLRSGSTVLISASWRGHVDIVNALLNHGADINVRTKDGNSPFLAATRAHHLQVMKILLSHGAILERPGSNDPSPLMMALTNGTSEEIVNLLLKAGCDANARNKKGEPMLVLAEEPRPENLNASTAFIGFTPILGSFGRPQSDTSNIINPIEVLRSLLEGGAKVDSRDIDERTALMLAARYGRLDHVRLLIKYGADVNAGDNLKNTVIIQSVQGIPDPMTAQQTKLDPKPALDRLADISRYNRVIKLLIDLGANVNARNRHGQTALGIAIQGKKASVIPVLKKAGAHL